MKRIAGNNTNLTKRALDFYPTDPAWVHVLMRHENFSLFIDEPCCGDGAISKVLKEHGHEVFSSDIKDCGYPGTVVTDALKINDINNVITNPPYNIATTLINHWIDRARDKVAVLMRLGYLDGQQRYEQFKGRRPHKIILIVDRMLYSNQETGKKEPSQYPHVWLIWDNTLPPVDESVLIWDRI